MNIQLKKQLNNTLITQISGLMQQYNISASDMESALESTLLSIKDLVIQEYIQEVITKEQEKQAVEESSEEQLPQD